MIISQNILNPRRSRCLQTGGQRGKCPWRNYERP